MIEISKKKGGVHVTQEEITALFDQYHNMVYRLALTLTRSAPDAEDVTQTVFLKLLSGCPPPQKGAEKAWLTRVTVNCCRDLFRFFRKHPTLPLEEAEAVGLTPEENALWDALMTLNAAQRAAVHLHYYEGYSIEETAALLRVKPSTISMRLHRARKQLRSILKEENP